MNMMSKDTRTPNGDDGEKTLEHDEKRLFVHPLKPTTYGVGDPVVDITAEANHWPDIRGTVEEIDGNNVKVRYEGSGNVRWKMHINLRLDEERKQSPA